MKVIYDLEKLEFDVDRFSKLFNSNVGIPLKYLYPNQLDDIEFSIIEKYLRKKKLESIKNNIFNNE